MKKIQHKYIIMASVSILAICLFIGNLDLNVDTKFTTPIENDDLNLYTSDGDDIPPGEDPPDESDSISLELIETETIFDTNTSAEDQTKISWGYSEWRAYIIFQCYNVTEAELDDSILNNETAQFNLHISTIMAWGQYNGSLSEEELLNLYNQMEHHTVRFDSSGYYESSDERLTLRTKISVRSIWWLLQDHKAVSLDISFWSSESNGRWHYFDWIIIPRYTHMKYHYLNWRDKDTGDLSFTQRSVYSNIPTGSLENNLYVKFVVNCKYNSISIKVIKTYRTHLVDDDTQGPLFLTRYVGSYTDGNPGYHEVYYAYDASGYDISKTKHDFSRTLGWQFYIFVAIDKDNDREGDSLASFKWVWAYILDDDTTAPVIAIGYIGPKTNQNPGIWRVFVSDPESGVKQISVVIDGIFRGSTAGDYTVPSTVGPHTISVYAINNDIDRGSVDQESRTKSNTVTIAIAPPTDPIVDVGPDQTKNEGDTASFVGSFEDAGTGEIYTYDWDFGDGIVILDAGTLTPSHKYVDDGTYEVTLTVSDNFFGVGSDTLIVTVNNVAPTVEVESDQTIDEGGTASFSGSFSDIGNDDTLTYNWDFGDGTVIYDADDLIPTHTYLDNGTYTVTLTVFDGDGGIGTDTVVVTVNNVAPTADAGLDQTVDEGYEVTFSGSFTDPGVYDTHTIKWDFGDGATDSDTLTPTHIYRDNGVYTVTLNVSDNSGDFSIDTLVVTVNNVAPTVDAEPDQTIDEGFAFTFSGSFTDLGADDTHTYVWDFGDGHTATGTLTPTHTYGDNGVYTVTLTVTDDDDGVGTNSSIFTVNNVDPTANAGPDQTVDEGEIVIFDGSFVDPGEDDDHEYQWDFGDGTVIDVPGTLTLTPTHVYRDNGFYTVTLTVFDDDGGSGSATLTVTVLNVAPTVDAGPDLTVKEGYPFTLSGSFTDPGWLDTHTIYWMFWDVDHTGILIVLPGLNPRFVYGTPGEYTVTFVVIDDDEDFDSETVTITVLDKTPPTTTLTFLGDFQLLDHKYISSTATEIKLTAIDAEMPYGSGVKRIQYQIDTTEGPWVPYEEPFTIDSIGTHIIYYRSIDIAENDETPKLVEVIVDASELEYLGGFEGTYSDPVLLKANLTDIATGLPIPGKYINFTINTQKVSAITQSDGTAYATLILDQCPVNDYTVFAYFEGDEEYLPSDSEEYEFTINKEYAYAEYTGDMVVPLDADFITLRATVFDDDDGNWGDLTKIWVNITIWDSTNVIPLDPDFYEYILQVEITHTPEGVGVADITIPNNLLEEGYLLQISFEPDLNDYYSGDTTDFVTLIIYEPTGDFVTGGGWIEDANGNKGNFGFNVKYKKNGLPKGQLLYIYREGDYMYIFKANAWVGMAIISDDNYTIFEARCNVKKIYCPTGEIVFEDGNYRLVIEAWDHSEDGKGDVIQIRVYDKYGIAYHESGFGFLGGGNIVIHVNDEKN